MTAKRFAAVLLKEPLVHFLAIACAILAIDHWALGNQENPLEIVVDEATYQELLGIFLEGQSRLPSEAEMGALLLKWSENEVLYREAQRLGLDQGDEMIRSRLILKIRNILFSNVVMPTPSEQELREWLDANRARYDRPAIYDFEQVKLGSDATEATAREAAHAAARNGLDEALAGHVRRYQDRPAASIEAVFAANDARALLEAPPNTWCPARSSAGWHIARITRVDSGVKAQFDAIRGKLAQDWEAEARQRQLAAALRAIVKDYDIRLDLDAERVRDSLTAPAVASRSGSK